MDLLKINELMSYRQKNGLVQNSYEVLIVQAVNGLVQNLMSYCTDSKMDLFKIFKELVLFR